MKRPTCSGWRGALLCAALAAPSSWSADHAESPAVTADPAADIGDVYIFRPDPAAPVLVGAITFGGRPSTAGGGVRIDGPTMFCDRDLLYVINIDHGADGALDAVPDIRVLARLALDEDLGECHVRIENIPGTAGRIVSGRANEILADRSGLRAFAGLVEDPFFFDTAGLGEMLATFPPEGPTGEIRFRNDRDTLGGRNISVIVFEMDLAAATGGNPDSHPVIQVWGDTYRFPGEG